MTDRVTTAMILCFAAGAALMAENEWMAVLLVLSAMGVVA